MAWFTPLNRRSARLVAFSSLVAYTPPRVRA